MSCKCARPTDQYHGWECTITGGECMYLVPNSKQCAKDYGEGPDAEDNENGEEDYAEYIEIQCPTCGRKIRSEVPAFFEDYFSVLCECGDIIDCDNNGIYESEDDEDEDMDPCD